MEHISSVNRFPEWFPVFFAVLWLGISGLLSFAGGWHQLASRFEASSRIDGETFRFASMSLGSGLFPVSYGNCLFITVGRSGVRLSILFLFRFLHPPLFIPWSSVEAVQPEKFWFLTYTAVRIRGFNKRMLFPKRVGKKLMETFNAQDLAIPA